MWVCGYVGVGGERNAENRKLKAEILTTEDTKYTEKEKKAGDRERVCVGVGVSGQWRLLKGLLPS